MKFSYELEHVAKVCHEMNRRFCELNNLPVMPAWEELGNFDREFLIGAVEVVISNPTVSPEIQHDNWCKAKVDDGWKVGEFNAQEKTHPLLVSYEELPNVQKVKDQLFLTLVRGYLT